eukprot:jgi/Bigna1/140731/aug1.58_g15439
MRTLLTRKNEAKRIRGSRFSLLKQIESEGDALFQQSLNAMVDAIRLYGQDKLMVSFNGGKDATAVLYLTMAATAKYMRENADKQHARINAVYFYNPKSDFEGTLKFVEDTCKEHSIKLTILQCGYKHGVEGLVSKGFKAFVIGTRSTDPNGKSGEFYCPSTKGWPAFMRINPIINWSYGAVWRFLRTHKIRYFHLYDEGYTSLGSRHTTCKNSLLLNKDGTYRPAYALDDWASERLVRKGTTDSKTEK